MAFKFNRSFSSNLDFRDEEQSGVRSANSVRSYPDTAHSNNFPGQENPPSFLPSPNPSKLSDFFAPSDEPRRPYSDWDVLEISRCLRESGHQTWSEAPRLYTVLRTIGQLQLLDGILEKGVSDVWFPFNVSSVPVVLSASLRAQFLEVQRLILTKAVDLEKSDVKKHTHFGRDDSFPFEIKEKLGKGGSGTVDKIYSPFSRRDFARKRFLRGKSRESRGEIESFQTELRVLKRIAHHHCIELVASYTDTKYFGLILSPVADCNLADFYSVVVEDSRNQALLRLFYGCLASGLQYLHSSKIRHRDIKPENILVKNECIYLADFGISLDWDALTRSTTTEDTGKSWIYCAPEVANYEKRNSSSDIWSLGCVFFEMCTVLKGRDIQAMRQHFKRLHDTYKFYQCLRAIHTWAEELLKIGSETDNNPLYWAVGMMQHKPESRPNASDLCSEINRLGSKTDGRTQRFCGDCCGTSSDPESANGSVSDGDLWAENLDDEIISPTSSLLTSPQTTDPSVLTPTPQAEAEADQTSVHDRSTSRSSTKDATAVPKVNVEPGIPADTSLKTPIEAPIKAPAETMLHTRTVVAVETPVEAPGEAYLDVTKDPGADQRAVPVAIANFQEPRDEPLSRTLVESSDMAAANPFRLDPLNFDFSTNGALAEELFKNYEACVEASLETPVDTTVAEPDKHSTTILPVGSKTVLPYPSLFKAHSREAIGVRDNDVNNSLEHISPDTTEIDQVQGSSIGDPLAQGNQEQSKSVQSPPIRQPPVPPKVTIGHSDRAEKERTDAEEITTSTNTNALQQYPANKVSPTLSLASRGKASPSSSSKSLIDVTGTPEHMIAENPLGPNHAATPVNAKALQTIQSEERKVKSVENQNFPFINAESWRSPDQYVGDVIKDPALMRSLKFDDFPSLLLDKNPETITTLVEEMIAMGLPVDKSIYTDAKGFTPIFNILDWGEKYRDLVKLMIDAGAPIDKDTSRPNDPQTPLSRSAARGFIWALEMLMDAGANPKRPVRRSALGQAAAFGQLEVVQYLIEKVECNPDHQDLDGATPLLFACLHAQAPIVTYLLEHYRSSIDIEARYTDVNNWGNVASLFSYRDPPIVHACCSDRPSANRLEVIKVLLKHGADPTGRHKQKSWSLLHIAAYRGDIELVKFLLQYGVKISARTTPVLSGSVRGWTPITLAEMEGHKEIVELLRAAKKKG